MKVSELIEKLSALPPDTDVVINGRCFFDSDQLQTKALRFVEGHMVCGPDNMTEGYFVTKESARRVMDDGKEFLDLRSKWITPALYLSFHPYPEIKRKKKR